MLNIIICITLLLVSVFDIIFIFYIMNAVKKVTNIKDTLKGIGLHYLKDICTNGKITIVETTTTEKNCRFK